MIYVQQCLLCFLLKTAIISYAQSTDRKEVIPQERGKVLYENHCLACHQAGGSGVPNLNPPLIKTEWTLGQKDKLIRVILAGLDEEIEVDGETYHNVMPPMPHLSDREIAEVLTFVRTNFSNNASRILEADVKAVRDKLE